MGPNGWITEASGRQLAVASGLLLAYVGLTAVLGLTTGGATEISIGEPGRFLVLFFTSSLVATGWFLLATAASGLAGYRLSSLGRWYLGVPVAVIGVWTAFTVAFVFLSSVEGTFLHGLAEGVSIFELYWDVGRLAFLGILFGGVAPHYTQRFLPSLWGTGDRDREGP